MRLAPDTLIAGRYRVGARLAGGGMGEVWVARDERLERDVAVKVIRPELSGDAEFLERFRSEARAAAGLSHPGVVAVHDFGEDREGAFLVMELVQGESLAARLIRAGPIGYEAVLDLLAQASEAVQAAHDAGVVHRDIKPANLLLRSDGRVQVTDFGTARALGATSVTMPGAIIGTPQYLAPEHANGGDVTPVGDVFALGVVAYEALTGRRPFEGPTVAATVAALLHADPPPLPASVPPAVAALVLACLARDPADRVASARSLAARARALLPPDTPPTPIVAPPVAGAPAPPAGRSEAAAPPPPPPPPPAEARAKAPAEPSPTEPAPPTRPAPDTEPPPTKPIPADTEPPPPTKPIPDTEPASTANQAASAEPLPPPVARAPRPATRAEPSAAQPRRPPARPAPPPRRRRVRPGLLALIAIPVVALAIIGGLALNREANDSGDSPAPSATPTATASPTPSATATAKASPSPTSTPAATATATGIRVEDLIGRTPAAASARLRDAGYQVTISYSSSTRGNPPPGRVHAVDPDPLPARGGRVRVIAQPSG